MPVPCEEELLVEGEQCIFSPPPMKHRDTRDSISSTDSDISMTYDTSCPVTVQIDPPAAELSDSGSDSTGKDSGCEITEPEFIPPDDELAHKIVTQVEFYFSDVNITKDAFLLKHVKRNKEGYVSLKLISSFKRVKHLCKDWRAVAYSLQHSQKLEINESKTKLRRVDPLPQYDETTPSRTVVALNLPVDKPTIENVAELFSCYGDIALIRILRPGNPIPADVRQFVTKHSEIGTSVCALVEFEKTESAKRAVAQAASKQTDWRGSMRVVELLKPVAKKTSKKETKKDAEKQQSESGNKQHRVATDNKKRNKKSQLRVPDVDSCLSGSDADDRSQDVRRRSHPGSGRQSQDRRSDVESRAKSNSLSEPLTLSPWVQRRLAAARDNPEGRQSPLLRPRSNSGAAHGGLTLPENVVRLPKGPDGTRGFSCGFRERLTRGRTPVLVTVTAC